MASFFSVCSQLLQHSQPDQKNEINDQTKENQLSLAYMCEIRKKCTQFRGKNHFFTPNFTDYKKSSIIHIDTFRERYS